MGFFQRLGAVLAADAHGVVDAIEDDELVLKQCLREAETEVQRKRAHLEGLAGEERLGRDRLAAAGEAAAALERDVSLALEGAADDLARFAIRRLLPLRREVEARTRRLAALERERAELAGSLASQRQELEGLRARVRDHLAALAARAADPAAADSSLGGSGAVADEEVELELLRRRRAPGGAL